MKTKNYIVILLIVFSIAIKLQAQEGSQTYLVTSGEAIFSQNQTSFTPEFLQMYPGAAMADSRTRFTIFLHLGQYIHHDFNNNFGFFSGLGIRNVGMITDETLPQTVTTTGQPVSYTDYKIIRRQYMLGVPLAIKIGSFKDHFYVFGGGEYELAFVLKEKYWTDTWDRDGAKTKDVTWFSSQTPTFFPSVFAGIQFPGGFNIRFKYYLIDFLDNSYKVSKNSEEGSTFSVSDLTRYAESKVFYVSLCWQFKTSDALKKTKSDGKITMN